MYNECDDLGQQEVGTEQVCQILCVSVAVQTYWLNDKRIFYMFLHLFRAKQCGVEYESGGRYLQGVVQTSQRWLSSPEKFEVLSTAEMLLFLHALSLTEYLLHQKEVRALCNFGAQTGTIIKIVIQWIVKAFSALCRPVWLRPLSKLVVPYVILDKEAVRFSVSSGNVHGLAPILQSKVLSRS